MTQVTRYVSFNLICCPQPNPPDAHFADPAVVCKLAENNANYLNKVLNLTSPGLLCGLPKTEHRTNEIKCILAQELYDHHSISEEYLS